ncbi:MAG: hypothetical protein Q8900_13630 [Bacillota bacterium]|nr:hypothetical protein [Bacillota bacterium]
MIFFRWLCGIVVLFLLMFLIFNNGLTLINIFIISFSLIFIFDIFVNWRKSKKS